VVINAVLWRTRTGSPWRDVPECYGSWKTVYDRHRRWAMEGVWASVLDELPRGCDEAEGPDRTVAVEGTVVCAPNPGDLNICPVTNLESRQSKDALLWSYVFGWDEFGGVVAVVS
jgi:transposase